jgi:hypothetical protein
MKESFASNCFFVWVFGYGGDASYPLFLAPREHLVGDVSGRGAFTLDAHVLSALAIRNMVHKANDKMFVYSAW